MARQRSHSRTRRAGGRFRGLYQFLCALLVVGAVFAACIVFFRVHRIRVEGAHRYTEEEIIQASNIQEGDYLILLDKYRVQRRIRSQLPYVERVSPQRILPDTVVITVEETAAAAALQCQGRWWLVNSSGKILESVSQVQTAGYPVVTGVELLSPEAGMRALVSEEEQNRWTCALELLTALEQRQQLSRLNRLECSAGSLTARYDETYTLLLPTTIEYTCVTSEQFSYFLSQLDMILDDLEKEGGGQDLVDFTLWESTGKMYARQSGQRP